MAYYMNIHFFFREFNQSYRIDAKNWIRQVESLADQFDYTLLMECSENYVCQVKNGSGWSFGQIWKKKKKVKNTENFSKA